MSRPYIDYAQLGGVPLPRRLGDPVRTFRRILGWWLLAVPLLGLLSLMMPDLQDRALGLALSLPLFFFLWRALPHRRTNAFYLRAFRTDASTADIRKAIQVALGNHYRLSGIRAPRRRWPQWLRALNRAAFCLHYSSVRYMNLEARDDWFARLWRSLAEARCAFVDLVDVTEHVATEITLACRALGFERVLFLGDNSRSIAEWQTLVCKQLGELHVKPDDVQVAIWSGPTSPEREAFQRAVNDFQHRLPIGDAGLNWAAFPTVQSAAYTYGQRWREAAFEVGTFLLCLTPLLVFRATPTVLAAQFPGYGPLIALLISLPPFLFLCASIVHFIRECPVRDQQVRFALGFAGLLVFYIGINSWWFHEPVAREWYAWFGTPTTIRIETSYPGQTAPVVAGNLAATIEQQVAGVESLYALRSWSLADGTYRLDVRFEPGSKCFRKTAETLVTNRVNVAQPQLPDAVRDRISLHIHDDGEAIVASVLVFSPDGKFDPADLSAHATGALKDALARLPGVAGVTVFGAARRAPRLIVDTHRLSALGLSSSEVLEAVKQFQNRAGDAAPRADEVTGLTFKTRDDRAVRLREFARVEAGLIGPMSMARFRQKPVVALAVTRRPTTRPRDVTGAIRTLLPRLEAHLPDGLRVELGIDFTPNFEAPHAATTPGYVLIDVTPPDSASIDETVAVLARCESLLCQVPGVADVLALTEHPFDFPRNRPCLLVRVDPADRADMMARIRERLRSEILNALTQPRDLSVARPFPAVDFPIELAVCDAQNAGMSSLLQAADTLAAALKKSPLLTDVAVCRPRSDVDVVVEWDLNQALAEGVSRKAITDTISLLLDPPTLESSRDGANAPKQPSTPTPDAANRWHLRDLPTLRRMDGVRDILDRAVIPRGFGAPVRIVDLVRVQFESTEDVVERVNLYPMIAIRANLAPNAWRSEARAFCEQEAARTLPPAYKLQWLQKPGRP